MAFFTKHLLALASFVWWGLASASAADPVRPLVTESEADGAFLAEQRIETTRDGLFSFLREFQAELAEAEKAKKLIVQLGDDEFRVRVAASRSLIEAKYLPLKVLQKAAQSSDPEVASRAEGILNHPLAAAKIASAENRTLLFAAVCRTIGDKAVPGITKTLFEIIPQLDDPDLCDVASEAIAACAGIEEAPLLRQNLVSQNRNAKIAAIRGTRNTKLLSEAELHRLTEDTDPRIGVAAAHTLAERGERSALAILVRLASAKDEFVRARSEQVLRAWSGRNFGFDPFQDPAAQEQHLERWRTWTNTDGKTAKLHANFRLERLPDDWQRGLVLHYAFEQAKGGRLVDESRVQKHGTVLNAHSLVEGVKGKALELQGQGDMGDRGGYAALPFIDFAALRQFTVALWVKETGMTDEHGEAYVVFGADREVGLEDSLGISHFNNSMVYRIGGAVVEMEFDKADRNRWVHYALTFEDGRLRAYKGGKLVGEAKGRASVVGKQAALGRHWWHHGEGTSTRFIGALDELRIYQRALTGSQIAGLCRSSEPKHPQINLEKQRR